MKTSTTILGAVAFAMTACTSEPPQSYEAATPVPTERVGIRYSDVFVREVSLPSYAASETIFLADPNGLLTEQVTSVWADDPTRAVTLGLSQSLQAMTGARVAPEPWPFGTNPEVTVDVRVETFSPGTDGLYRAAGQVFVAPEDEEAPNRSLTFRLTAPFDVNGGQPAIAAARSNLVSQLSANIARRGLR